MSQHKCNILEKSQTTFEVCLSTNDNLHEEYINIF